MITDAKLTVNDETVDQSHKVLQILVVVSEGRCACELSMPLQIGTVGQRSRSTLRFGWCRTGFTFTGSCIN